MEELKNSIENRSVSDEMIVFKITDTDFICTQYIKEISKIKNLDIEYIDSLSALQSKGLFNTLIDDSLKVFKCDELVEKIPFTKNVIIISKKVDTYYNDYVYEIPKLESWQITDYAYSILEDVSHKDLDYIISLCKDVYRLDNELSKLTIFDRDRQNIFNEFISDDIFNDLSNYVVFDLTNALVKKDKEKVKSILKELSNIDIDTIGFITILINSFKDIISIQFDPRVTADELGISNKKFWAIRYSCGFYSKESLVKIFKLLNSIDMRLKVGDLPEPIILDYVITNILSED